MKKVIFTVLLSFLSISGFASDLVQIISVNESPMSENAAISIVFPKTNKTETSSDVKVQLRVRGFSIGNRSQVPRTNDLANSRLGQSIHVIIDNESYFAKAGPSIAPFDEEGNYYESMYKFKIPFSLDSGEHSIRVFLARSFGESIKSSEGFASSYFYVNSLDPKIDQDLDAPYITYNEPSSYMRFKEQEPILLDFYISNCELSQDGYKVKVIVDNKITRILTRWTPYYIYGLKKGTHKIKLELLDKNDQRVEGEFNNNSRKFRIY
ncbi:MAG: hypothetical protein K1060chlam5_00282 [Candidatus Anoxychlamydiales bacterium]|nr:hypothetical protein [Candidatus Anoxychlamydiales bacterium]